jgi:hypothetical protein
MACKKRPNKSLYSVVIEFMDSKDSNKIIDEWLIWRGKLCLCEAVRGPVSPKSMLQVPKYGYIGNQGKATTHGFCAAQGIAR